MKRKKIESSLFALAKTKYSNSFETLFFYGVLENENIFSELFIHFTGMDLKPVPAAPRNEHYYF